MAQQLGLERVELGQPEVGPDELSRAAGAQQVGGALQSLAERRLRGVEGGGRAVHRVAQQRRQPLQQHQRAVPHGLPHHKLQSQLIF